MSKAAEETACAASQQLDELIAIFKTFVDPDPEAVLLRRTAFPSIPDSDFESLYADARCAHSINELMLIMAYSRIDVHELAEYCEGYIENMSA
jgi:hypothetical protein